MCQEVILDDIRVHWVGDNAQGAKSQSTPKSIVICFSIPSFPSQGIRFAPAPLSQHVLLSTQPVLQPLQEGCPQSPRLHHAQQPCQPRSAERTHQLDLRSVPRHLHESSRLMIDPSDPDMINIEGTIRYLETMELDPEEPVVLVLAYQLDSPSIGAFTRTGFVEGWRTIGYLPRE